MDAPTQDTPHPGALFDLTVIDLGHYIAGPYAATLLAGLGAEVIKVERPGVGDGARRMGPFPEDQPHPEKSGLFSYLNLGKKSVTLNLKTDSGREALHRLAAQADVVIENFSPRVMPSLGLAYENLKQVNEDVILTSISNFGQNGPYRDYRGYEITLSALGGVQAEIGEPDREPLKLGGQQLQFMAGLAAALATMSAVCCRDLGGGGQWVDVAISEIAATLKGCPATNFQFTGYNRVRNGMRPMSDILINGDPRIPDVYPISILPCRDGYVCIDTEQENQFQALCGMIGRPELADDRRFNHWKQRCIHADELDAMLSEYLADKTQQQVLDQAMDWRVPVGISNDMEQLFNDPQLRARGFFTEVDHPLLGRTAYPGPLFIMSETPWRTGRSPLLGEHNQEILMDRLGLSAREIEAAQT